MITVLADAASDQSFTWPDVVALGIIMLAIVAIAYFVMRD